MAVDAVLFDCDEVLVSSAHCWLKAINDALEYHGITPLQTPKEQQSIGHRPLEVILRKRGHAEQLITQVRRMRNDRIVKLLEQCPWRDGARALLSDLLEQSVPSGIVSNSFPLAFNVLDGSLHIRTLVREVVLGDELAPDRFKPHPQGIHLACERLRVNPKRIVFIGDMPSDMKAAKRAGGQGILLKGQLTPPDFRHPHFPAHDTFTGIRQELRTLGINLPD